MPPLADVLDDLALLGGQKRHPGLVVRSKVVYVAQERLHQSLESNPLLCIRMANAIEHEAVRGDVLQPPGVFVIGAEDLVCRAFVLADPAGHPSPDDILKAVAGCPGGPAPTRP